LNRRKFGLGDDEIAALLRDDWSKFSAGEQAFSGARANVSRELFAELRRHFTEEQLIELAADAAQENYRARWSRVFNVGSDALYSAIPYR
jgi:alkylhydroperoxidase family enzyme